MNLLSPYTHITLIDDNIDEIKDILNLFHKYNTPHTYYAYDGSKQSLPSSPSGNIRLLFMDLYLLDDGVKDENIVSGRFMTVLSTVLKIRTPYVLIIWSKHIENSEQQDKDPSYLALIDRLNEDTSFSPLAIIPLDKTHFISINGDTNAVQEKLEYAIQEAIENNITARMLLQWSNLVGQSANITLSDLRELMAGRKFNTNYTERIFFEFARAYLGKHTDDIVENHKHALHFVTEIFKDNIENCINNIGKTDMIEFKENNLAKPNKEEFALINFKTLLSNNGKKNPPGSVYEISNSQMNALHTDFYLDFFNINNYADKLIKDEKINKNEAIEKSKIYFKGVLNRCTFVYVDITPICDYAQDKYIYKKFCAGVMISEKAIEDKYLKIKSNFYYKTPHFLFNTNVFCIVLDLRLISTSLQFSPSKVLFRFREQLLVDIQHKISQHIGRPGFVFMDFNLTS